MVGYLTATTAGIVGERGMGFDYVFAKGGVYLSVKNEHIAALVCIAPTDLRGLAEVQEKIELLHGKIPRRFYELALGTCLIPPFKERWVGVVYDRGEYRVEYPDQAGQTGHVAYNRPGNLVLDIHSHPGDAYFSSGDDADDLGLKFSMVLGNIGEEPEYRLRLCAYGFYKEMDFEEVIDGCTISGTNSRLQPSGDATSSDAVGQARSWRSRLPVFFREMLR